MTESSYCLTIDSLLTVASYICSSQTVYDGAFTWCCTRADRLRVQLMSTRLQKQRRQERDAEDTVIAKAAKSTADFVQLKTAARRVEKHAEGTCVNLFLKLTRNP